MNEPLRFISAIVAVIVYAGLIIEKIYRIRAARITEQTEETDDSLDPEYVLSLIKLERRILRFGLIRLCLDCLLLLGFILTNLWPAWFSLFPDNTLMFYTACAILITATLFISVLTDWFPIREGFLQIGGKPPKLKRFLVRQFVSIIRVESVMAVVWVVLLALEPTGLTPLVKAVIAVVTVVLLRGLQDMIRKRRENKTES